MAERREGFYIELLDLLKQDPENRFYSENGKDLLRNKLYECAMKMDKDLIKLLLSNERIKNKFFTDVDGLLVFDKTAFGWAINNKAFLNDSYTRFKNTIGLIDSNEQFISSKNDVVLSFPYKDCVLEGGQTKEDQKRDEIYYNELLAPDDVDRLLAPKVFTNAKRYTKDGEEVITTFNDDDNLLIKGNNLLALSSILKRYEGKVKCIYIDPPFNTGNDSFNYNDRFSRSSWLTFMKNRLNQAKRLLSNDGNIFVHIDKNQSHYLKVLLDEIFSEENFVEEIIWAYGSPSGGRAATPKPVNVHDYILHYSKNYNDRKQNRVYIPYSEKYIKDWFKYDDGDGRLYQRRQRGKDDNGQSIWVKQYLDESKGIPLSTVWNDIQQVYADPRAYKSSITADVEVIKEFKGGQKPEKLLKRILQMCTDENDLILDYHIGTGTSLSVAQKMHRRYIGIEQMEEQIDIATRRLVNVFNGEGSGISKEVNWQGGGSFVYCELKELNKKYIDEIMSANNDKLIELYPQIIESEFISYKADINKLKEGIEDFKRLETEEKRHFLIEILDKNLLYVNYSDIEDEDFCVSEEEKAFTKSFYGDV